MRYRVYIGPKFNMEGLLCADFLKWQGHPVELNDEIGPFLVNSRGHGCPTVYELKDGGEYFIADGFQKLYEWYEMNGYFKC